MSTFHRSFRSTLLSFALIIFAGFFFYLNDLFPLNSDDFIYSFCFGNNSNCRPQNIQDVLRSVWAHTHCSNGREFATFCIQTFIFLGKAWFNIVNVLVYMTSTLLLTLLIRPFRLSHWLFWTLLLWIAVPAPGDSLFWISAACAYHWGFFFNLLFLVLLFSESDWCRWCAIPVGLFAGNAHEALSASLFCGLLIYSLLTLKEKKVSSYYIAILSLLVGLLLNVMAPATAARAGVLGKDFAGHGFLISHVMIATRGALSVVYKIVFLGRIEYLLPFGLCFIACISNVVYRKKFGIWDKKAILFGIAAVVGLMIPVAANSISPRAFFSSSVYGLISLGFLLSNWIQNSIPSRCSAWVALILLNALTVPMAISQIAGSRLLFDTVSQNLSQGENAIFLSEDKVKKGRFSSGGFYSQSLNNNMFVPFFGKGDFAVITDNEEIKFIRSVSLNGMTEGSTHETETGGWVLCTRPGITAIDTRTTLNENTLIWPLNHVVGILKKSMPPLASLHVFPATYEKDGKMYVFIRPTGQKYDVTLKYEDGSEELLHLAPKASKNLPSGS